MANEQYKTCPFKMSETHSCRGNYVSGPVICNTIQIGDNKEPWTSCRRWFTESALHDLMEKSGLKEFCCTEMRMLFHDCAEGDGHMEGGFAILKNETDHKMVWRNFNRTHFRFCPYCGSKLGKPFIGRYATADSEAS